MRLKAIQAFNTPKDALAITEVRVFLTYAIPTYQKLNLTPLGVSFTRFACLLKLENEKFRGLVVRCMGGVKCQPLSKV